MTLRVAFSPCPNDTFLFHAWVNGLVGAEVPMTPVLADVEMLNGWAAEGKYPVSKVSIGSIPKLFKDYVLLPSGCALGTGCGPKVVAKQPIRPSEFSGKRIAIPGQNTTAHLLLQLLFDVPISKTFCTYDEVTNLVSKGTVDLGLIIHETRFTLADSGLVEVADLGTLWEERYHLPIPLGGVVAKRELGHKLLEQIATIIAQSLAYARASPQESTNYILAHSLVKDPEVVRQHIDLYVTAETEWLSETGQRSIDTLFAIARERNLLPANPVNCLFAKAESLTIR